MRISIFCLLMAGCIQHTDPQLIQPPIPEKLPEITEPKAPAPNHILPEADMKKSSEFAGIELERTKLYPRY